MNSYRYILGYCIQALHFAAVTFQMIMDILTNVYDIYYIVFIFVTYVLFTNVETDTVCM